MKKIEKVNVFMYAGYIPPVEEVNYPDEIKNELWVQLKLLQDKINEIIDLLSKRGGKEEL